MTTIMRQKKKRTVKKELFSLINASLKTFDNFSSLSKKKTHRRNLY